MLPPQAGHCSRDAASPRSLPPPAGNAAGKILLGLTTALLSQVAPGGQAPLAAPPPSGLTGIHSWSVRSKRPSQSWKAATPLPLPPARPRARRRRRQRRCTPCCGLMPNLHVTAPADAPQSLGKSDALRPVGASIILGWQLQQRPPWERQTALGPRSSHGLLKLLACLPHWRGQAPRWCTQLPGLWIRPASPPPGRMHCSVFHQPRSGFTLTSYTWPYLPLPATLGPSAVLLRGLPLWWPLCRGLPLTQATVLRSGVPAGAGYWAERRRAVWCCGHQG